MRTSIKVLSLTAGLALLAAGPAMAQQAGTASGTPGQKSGVAVGASGVTSGPAATGQPATLGTTGTPATVPHQTELLRHKGGVPIKGEKQVRSAGTHKGGSNAATQKSEP